MGVALTQLSKGDVLLSLFLTVASNILGILTIPMLIELYITSGNVVINSSNLAYKLSISVLTPTIAGMFLRQCSRYIPEFTKEYKQQLSMISSAALMVIVWLTLSKSQATILQQNVGEIFLVLLANIIIHTFFLLANYFFLRYALPTAFSLEQIIAVVIMASQKSSPVALSVINSITTSPRERGLLIIPCLLGQISQILIGSMVSNRFAFLVTNSKLEENRSPGGVISMQAVIPDDENEACEDTYVAVRPIEEVEL